MFALLTAIVSVKAGQVQGITWDDGCFFCPEAQCAAQNLYLQPDVPTSVASSATCFASQEQCTLEERHCDLVIYLGWTGTDVDGNYLSSAGTVPMIPSVVLHDELVKPANVRPRLAIFPISILFGSVLL